MSYNFNDAGNGHIYELSAGMGQDGHTQDVIGHTNSLFPQYDFDVPRLSTTGRVAGGANGVYANPLVQERMDDDHHLDDFDRRLLGRPQGMYHPNVSTDFTPRVSLPPGNVAPDRRPRVLGDASHHFRPFAPRGEDYEPQFPPRPLNHNLLEPSPASQPIFRRDGSRRVGGLQSGTQLVTPPFYAVERNRTSPHLSGHSSSSEPASSSPSTRLSFRRQFPKVATRPVPSQSPTTRLTLDLDHAPDDLTPVVNNIPLVNPRKALPDKCRTIFPYQLFNVVQSKCFPLAYGSNDNVVISAPTGSGKTAILEMAICRLVTSPGGENFKIVYQAPTKSLCSERARDWIKKFSHLNLQCVELTGDTSQVEIRRVGSASIIVTTPEKWDSITRKWKDHLKLLETIKLVLIDEVHILRDTRGATLETVVSRMKTFGADVRFIALSATVPNIQDIASWLGRDCSTRDEPAKWESFGEELRPVKLKKFVYGFDSAANDFSFEISLDGKLSKLLEKHSERKPIMIFCYTRKSCERTALRLAEWWCGLSGKRPWPAPTERLAVTSQELQEIVRYGIAFHHAGLDAQDRATIEQQFINGQLHVICCTSTLAVGVNLPCHTVILKGTMCYNDGGLQEYSDLEIIQMLGRAGRPQFDKSAVAIIMTKQSNVSKYETMMSGEQILESTLHNNLIEHINSEVGLHTIRDLASAQNWIAGTFLNVRMRQNPSHYNPKQDNMEAGSIVSQASPDDKIQEWCQRDIQLLQQHGLITDIEPFSCTEYGVAMSRYMVEFETMINLLAVPRAPTMEQLLTGLSKASAFRDIRFKGIERTLFKDLNSSILFPIKENITETRHKISLMVQIRLGAVDIPSDKDNGAMRRQISIETGVVCDRLNRLLRCFIDCRVFDGDAIGVRLGLELARCLAAGAWENHPSQLLQIPNIGPVAMRKFISHGIRSVATLADSGFEDIERILRKNPPFGKNLLKILDGFPRLRMTARNVHEAGTYTATDDTLSITLKVKLCYNNSKAPAWKGKHPAVTLLVETSDGTLVHFWRDAIRKIDQQQGLTLKFPVPLNKPHETISCHFSCEEVVGTQVVETVEVNIPSSAFLGRPRTFSTRNSKEIIAFASEISEDGISDLADEEVIDAVVATDGSPSYRERSNLPASSDESNSDLPEIHDVLDQEISVSSAPVQMANGKWMCNHHCRGGGLTKAGKPCIHRCCREGVDKPRLPQRKKKKSTDGHPCGNLEVDRLASVSATSELPVFTSANTSRKRSHSVIAASSNNSRQLKKSKGQRSDSYDFTDENIDCIDLSADLNDELEDPGNTLATRTMSSNDPQRKLGQLHNKTQNQDPPPSRLTKPHILAAKDGGSRAYPTSPNTYNRIRGISDDGESHYGSDIFESDDELPGLCDLVASKEPSGEDHCQKKSHGDETLCTGALERYQESQETGSNPNLSFTTCSELQRASQRLNLTDTHERPGKAGQASLPLTRDLEDVQPSGPEPMSAWSSIDLPTPFGNINPEGSTCSLADLENNQDSLLDHDSSQQGMPMNSLEGEVAIAQPNEPTWLADMDPELVNMLRGVVDFVD